MVLSSIKVSLIGWRYVSYLHVRVGRFKEIKRQNLLARLLTIASLTLLVAEDQ
ncbi:hypothetical protein SAMN06265348_10149 [Pedobacter westerhofensis]|uniref:Uncharacterized protein n=1 Tax=Pedobacter westerhofensis TaxID=425512 RepID=A0A521ACI4_9SPHI|nr:hypothetical protein SAMN06265348_10149 [Pedobacter westerhofensis]